MTVDTPANRFFCMIAATAIGGGVRQIFDYAKAHSLSSDEVAQMLTAELMYFACCVAMQTDFNAADLHSLLDEMRDEATEAAGNEAKH